MRQIYGSSINWIANYPREEICDLLRHYAAYSGNSDKDVSGKPVSSIFKVQKN